MKIKHITPRTLGKLIDNGTNMLFLCGDGTRHHFATVDILPVNRNEGDKILEQQIDGNRDKFQYFLEKTEKTDIAGYSTFLDAKLKEDVDKPHILYLKHTSSPVYTEEFKDILNALPQDDPILYNLESTGYLYAELCLTSDICLMESYGINTIAPELIEALKPVSLVVYFYIYPKKPDYLYYLHRTYIPETLIRYRNFIEKLAEISDSSKGECSLIPDNPRCELCHYHIPRSRQYLEMDRKCQKANHTGDQVCEEFLIDTIRRCENCYYYSPIDQHCHHQNNTTIKIDTFGKLIIDYKQKPMYGLCDLWKLEEGAI